MKKIRRPSTYTGDEERSDHVPKTVGDNGGVLRLFAMLQRYGVNDARFESINEWVMVCVRSKTGREIRVPWVHVDQVIAEVEDILRSEPVVASYHQRLTDMLDPLLRAPGTPPPHAPVVVGDMTGDVLTSVATNIALMRENMRKALYDTYSHPGI